MRRIVTAIIDTKATDITGNYLYIHKHMAQAVRMFQDAIANPEIPTMHQHPEDFELWQLGELTDENRLEGAAELLITGAAARAAADARPTERARDLRELRKA